MSEKTKKGELEKALLRIRRECMSAKPQPAADLGNWKREQKQKKDFR